MRILLPLSIATSILVAQNIDLDTVVVSATKSEQKLQDVTSNVVVITKEQLEEWHVDTLNEALSKAGVILAQNGGVGQSSSVYLQGFASKYTLVLVDGVKFNDPTAVGAAANIANIVLDDVEQIEIIKGAQSGIYGADAVAGVINIITKKAKKDSASLNFEYGSFVTKKSQVSISKKIGKLYGSLSYSYLKSKSFSAAADIKKDLDSYEDDAYENKSYNIKLGYDITSNDTLALLLYKISSDTKFDAGATLDSTIPNVKEQDKLSSIKYTHYYSQKNYTKLYYSLSSFNRDYIYDFMGNPTPANYRGEIREFGIDNRFVYNNYTFLFGANQTISKDKKSAKKLKATGVYLTTTATINNLVATATIRRDNYSDYKDKTTGKIGLKYSFQNGLVVSANYGTAYKVPTLSELYGFGGNPNLKPESIKSFDIRAEYQNFYVSYFYNSIKDAISYVYNPATFSGTYVNDTKKSKIKGFELGYRGVIAEDLFYSLNYTRYIAKDKDGYQLARRPNYLVNFNLDYYGFENAHINFNAQYVGKRVEYAYGTHNVTAQTGHIFVANLAADYQISKDLQAYVKINNIFDKKYQDVAGYASSPRAIYVGINAKF